MKVHPPDVTRPAEPRGERTTGAKRPESSTNDLVALYLEQIRALEVPTHRTTD